MDQTLLDRLKMINTYMIQAGQPLVHVRTLPLMSRMDIPSAIQFENRNHVLLKNQAHVLPRLGADLREFGNSRHVAIQ